MNNKPFWMVRAGEGAFLIDEFENRSVVAVGWSKLDSLSNVDSPDALRALMAEKYNYFKPGQLRSQTGQIIRFRFEFKNGDNVISYNPQRRVYLVGEFVSDYEYDSEMPEYKHIRRVKWVGAVDRDKLSAPAKNSLGAISTIFKVNDEVANEIFSLLKGDSKDSFEGEEKDLENIKDDMVENAHEFIKDKVAKLDWEEMQELVAGLLRGMGYKTTVSPRGPDRGRDIIASPDGLGFEDPRIVVEVKHRTGSMDSQKIRSFTGGLRPGHKGLYVSTGGFSKDARYEAERSNIPITLIDLDALVKLLVEYYDKIDVDTKLLVPLAKIYWPI